MDATASHELRTALTDLHRYLLDQIPPLTAVDAIETLMTQPPEHLIRAIQSWAIEQGRQQDVTQADLLFHALRKVYFTAVLKLIDDSALDNYLDDVIPLALKACPADERDALRASLVHLRDSITVDGSGVVPIASTGARAKTVEKSREAAAAPMSGPAKRLSMIFERIASRLPFVGGARDSAAPDPSSHLLTLAATTSKSEAELTEYLKKLEKVTGRVDPERIFHALAAAVPQWDIVVPPTVKGPAAIEAMEKIITLSPAADSVKRYRELVAEAVEQFNSGAIGSAVAMLDVAARAVIDRKIDRSTVERVQEASVDSIQPEQLRKYAENKTKHPMLRKALAHFPALTTEGLFEQLRGESRPERRRSILGLLEAYGSDARKGALVELDSELKHRVEDVDTYYLRNVIYLLHRIPRESEESVDQELDLLNKASARRQNIYVVKEAIVAIGMIKTEAAVRLLTTRLAEFEAMLLRKDISLYPMDEMQKTIDRICGALGRIATPAALLTIARHGMKPNPLLGDTRGRLSALAQHDLSFDDQTVDILMKAIRDDLPTKILGRVIASRQPPPLRLIEALSSTRAERVEVLFAEIAEKYPDLDVGRAAAAALANLTTPTTSRQTPSAATLTGDLEFFGLPSLLQSLADQQATGIVTLTGRPSNATAGKILFIEGKFSDAQVAHLRGVEALFQLLELPVSGTFAFVPQPLSNVKSKTQPLDVMGLLFEGIRRHDELRQMMIFVPDDLSLKATSVKPTMDPEETDPAFLRDLWVKASSGTRIADCERQIAVDSYRVRRLVSRWVEEGALQPAV